MRSRCRPDLGFALVLGSLLVLARASGAPAKPASPPSPIAGAANPVVGQTNSGAVPVPLIVAIDPGHGGTNLGASGPGHGIYEKRLTLALAERIRALLAEGSTSQPEVAVVLCRESDALVPIRARARCAQESGARLFLSLHANAVPAGVPRGSRRGFDVFVLGPREVEDDAALAALGQREDSDAVWAAHEVRAAAERSIVLARVVADHLAQTLAASSGHGVKQGGATLDVLRGAGTAAALVEVGFLDHPEEGARLASAEGREPIARALAAAIRAYLTRDAAHPMPISTVTIPPQRF